MRPLLALLLLSGCASFQDRMACQTAAGPEPYAAAPLFGIVGAMYAEAQPEMQAWHQRVEACMRGTRIPQESVTRETRR